MIFYKDNTTFISVQKLIESIQFVQPSSSEPKVDFDMQSSSDEMEVGAYNGQGNKDSEDMGHDDKDNDDGIDK